MTFKLASFRFILSYKDTILTPHLGFTLRGGLGYVFRDITCIAKEKTCKDCILKEKCVYSYLFESPMPGEKRYPYVPHPFIIEPPMDESPDFNLILIGKGIDHLPYFIYAFEELGKRGIGKEKKKFSIVEIKDTFNQIVYNGEGKILYKKQSEIQWDNFEDSTNTNVLEINFITPTRIKYQGKLTKDINFEIIIRNLLRRISLLSLYHCDKKWEIDFNQVIKKAKEVKLINSTLEWMELGRYSTRQKTYMKLGGFIGKIKFTGDLGPFMPYLKLGEYIHIGKATTFGFGKYIINS